MFAVARTVECQEFMRSHSSNAVGVESCFLGHHHMTGKLADFHWVHASDQASCKMPQFASNYRGSMSASLTSNCARHSAASGTRSTGQAHQGRRHMTRNHGHKLICMQLTGASV